MITIFPLGPVDATGTSAPPPLSLLPPPVSRFYVCTSYVSKVPRVLCACGHDSVKKKKIERKTALFFGRSKTWEKVEMVAELLAKEGSVFLCLLDLT